MLIFKLFFLKTKKTIKQKETQSWQLHQ